jgi:hypothetical protein
MGEVAGIHNITLINILIQGLILLYVALELPAGYIPVPFMQ